MAVNDDEPKGAFGRAKGLLGKVVGRVVDAALGTSRPPPVSKPRPASPAATPNSVADAEQPTAGGETPNIEPVVAVALGTDRMRVSWTLSPDALERARRVLGVPGELRARVVVVSTDLAQVVASEVREQPATEVTGAWTLDGLPAGARCAAAVGVQDGERFVSAGHARVVTL